MSIAKLAGYRTLISIAVSFVLKILVLKGVIVANQSVLNDLSTPITDLILLLFSGVFDLAAMYFRLKSSSPGQLTPEYKAQQEYLKLHPDRRSPS
jgi:hypothetical protein